MRLWVLSEVVFGEGCFDDAPANARLIAAAPDLLAACEAMVKLMEYVPDLTGIINPLEIAERARAAILKAKGEQP